MRADRSADAKLMSAGARKLGWTPECKSRQRSAPLRLGVIGELEVRLTRDKHDVRHLQKLRYDVFYKQRQAVGNIASRFTQRDEDRFDSICDHLMVVDHSEQPSATGTLPVVGTYRLLRQEIAEQHGGFYSAEEFDISELLKRHSGLRFLELGRSCVLPSYRGRRAIELLWRGVWSYVREHRVDVMIGCASFEGNDTERLARPLSFLHHFARAPEQWRAVAHPLRRAELNLMPKNEIDIRSAWRELSPLIKGYLRVGAFVADGAVIDPRFGTTDVLIILPVKAISARYIRYFGANGRHWSGA